MKNKDKQGQAMPETIPPPKTMTYTPVFDRLNDVTSRFVINYGGTASSKSSSAAQKEILIATQRKVKTLVVRKVGTTVRDSVWPSFQNRIEEFGYQDFFQENQTHRTMTCSNGSQFVFRGVDDPEKIKSIEGIDRILIEEATELTMEDFMELNRRARGREDIQITLTFNPITERHWIKGHFFDRNDEDTTFIKSTYLDNPFLTDADRKQITWMQKSNPNQYNVYALGEWGQPENNAPWLYAFRPEQHVCTDTTYHPGFPVCLSFDFNRDPVTCIAVQHYQAPERRQSFVQVLREFSVKGQLFELCQQIRTCYPAALLEVTGDASGHHGNVGFEARHGTYYKMIQNYLNIAEKDMHTTRRNMTHNDSRQLINTILHHHSSICISANCTRLIHDCTIATVDDEAEHQGVLKKDRGEYKMDLMDCLRYFFQAYYQKYTDEVRLKLG